jgi:hypothetical protein
MTEIADAATKPKTRKVLLQMLAGAICGAAGMIAGMTLLDRSVEGAPSATLAAGLGTGLVYLLTALIIGLGLLLPALGAKALNVEDAEELKEQRGMLAKGSLIFILVAVFLLTLTFAPAPLGAGLLQQETAFVVAGASFFGLLAASNAFRNSGDELIRQASLEAANLTLGLVFILFGGWAALNQVGAAAMFSPLLFVSGLFAIYLLCTFIAYGRRGMLKPR